MYQYLLMAVVVGGEVSVRYRRELEGVRKGDTTRAYTRDG